MLGTLLYLKLFGPVHVTQVLVEANEEGYKDSLPRFRSRRTVALLGYLARERRPIAREYLAALFCDSNNDENTLPRIITSNIEIHSVCPDINISLFL